MRVRAGGPRERPHVRSGGAGDRGLRAQARARAREPRARSDRPADEGVPRAARTDRARLDEVAQAAQGEAVGFLAAGWNSSSSVSSGSSTYANSPSSVDSWRSSTRAPRSRRCASSAARSSTWRLTMNDLVEGAKYLV